ncbi:MAG: hypothetical protein KF887_10745 [Paracoccaceae bacterium]|nr:MAG: hypothetical protein KF887_10745 [Paracoccaceae bacterium]
MRRLAMAAILAAGTAAAEPAWQPLADDALRAALAARTLVEKGAGWPLAGQGRTWNFLQDGRALSDVAGRRDPRWTGWRVDGARLCLEEPPGCARVERHPRGLDLRFVWEDGRVQVMRYVDL